MISKVRLRYLTLGILLLISVGVPFIDNIVRLSKDIIDSPLLYTRSRDIYCLGLVVLQMLSGNDVIHCFPSGFQSALRACEFSYFTPGACPDKFILTEQLQYLRLSNSMPQICFYRPKGRIRRAWDSLETFPNCHHKMGLPNIEGCDLSQSRYQDRRLREHRSQIITVTRLR